MSSSSICNRAFATLITAVLLGITGAAMADIAVPGPRPPQPRQPADNASLSITARDGASPAQLELPRAMMRREGRRADAATTPRIRLAMIVGGSIATLFFAVMTSLNRMGRQRCGRMLVATAGLGLGLGVGGSIVLADIAVDLPPENSKAVAPRPAVDGPTVSVRATEDAPGITLVVSPEVLRKAIADAEAAKANEKK